MSTGRLPEHERKAIAAELEEVVAETKDPKTKKENESAAARSVGLLQQTFRLARQGQCGHGVRDEILKARKTTMAKLMSKHRIKVPFTISYGEYPGWDEAEAAARATREGTRLQWAIRGARELIVSRTPKSGAAADADFVLLMAKHFRDTADDEERMHFEEVDSKERLDKERSSSPIPIDRSSRD